MRVESQSLRAGYAKENPLCEFALNFEQFRILGNAARRADETNHIWGGTSGRHDLISNLIRLSWENHRWFHQFPADGRVLSLWVKFLKGELDRKEIKLASGFFLEGWLLKAQISNAFVLPYLDKLKEAFP